jgi:hypothetical protein
MSTFWASFFLLSHSACFILMLGDYSCACTFGWAFLQETVQRER